LQAIKLELIKSGYWGSLHSGVVITGGSAGLKNIAKRANEILEIPVRVGFPRGEFSFSDILNSGEYATAIGLILYALNEGVSRKRPKSFLPSFSWLKDIFE